MLTVKLFFAFTFLFRLNVNLSGELRAENWELLGLMCHGACHTFPPAVFLVFLVPLAPFVFFVAQNLRRQLTSEFRESNPATACV